MTATYINPYLAPYEFTSSAEPHEHAGCLIYPRGRVRDVVVNGVCVTVATTLRRAKRGAERVQREIAEARAAIAAQETDMQQQAGER